MTHPSPALKEFFSDYEKNSNTGNLAGLTTQFAQGFLFADAAGTRFVPTTVLLATIPQRIKMLEAAGLRSTTLMSLDQTRINDRYTLVHTRWRMLVDREGHPCVEVWLDSTFIVHGSDEKFTIVFYLPHQDIMAVLEERGILPRT